MSQELETVGTALFFGKRPGLWGAASYKSLKPLAGYVSDYVERMAMFQSWLDDGPPTVFWVSGFFFTQAFLTGSNQNYAREFTIPIDSLDFDFEMLTDEKSGGDRPENGVYISGLYFDGARWDIGDQVLADSLPKVLFSPAPKMWLRPCKPAEFAVYDHYNCPMYLTSDRCGALATTGHSSNFVMYIRIPADRAGEFWIEAAVALLTQLDD